MLFYRQHTNNVVGSRNRSKSLWQKVRDIISNTNTGLSYSLAVALFNGYTDMLGKEKYRILKLVVDYKDSIWTKLRLVCSFKVFMSCHKKTNIRFVVSVLSGKF